MNKHALADGAYLTVLPTDHFLKIISSCMEEEGAAIHKAASSFSTHPTELVKLLTTEKARLFFTGIGKAGIVARKLAAIGASLGLQTFFLDPLNALHGDSGVCNEGDILMVISRSGTGPELATLLGLARTKKISSVVISCKQGPLLNLCTIPVIVPCDNEADEYNLVPTNSSAVLTAFGDGLLLALATHKGFHVETFARHHPAGSLGKRLMATAEEIMLPLEHLPLINEHESLTNVLLVMHHFQKGLAIVINKIHEVVGVVTSDTLRELHDKKNHLHDPSAAEIAHKTYIQAPTTTSVTELFSHMKHADIPWILITEENRIKGLIEFKTLIGKNS